MSKRYVGLLVLLLSYLSLVQAVAYEREGIAGRRLARTGDRQHGRHRGQKGQAEGSPQGSVLIVTETVKETVTAAAGSCTAVNGTIAADTVTETATVTVTQKENPGALPGTGNLQLSFVTTTVFGTGSPSTVTITALPETITQTIAATVTETLAQTITSLQVVASTVTITQIQSALGTCSSQVPGVVAGAPAGTAAPATNDGLPRASGGVGLTVVSIPAALRTSTLEIPPPAATDVPAISTSVSLAETTTTSTTSEEAVASSTSSVAEVSTTSTTAEEAVVTSSTELATSSTEEAIPSSTTELTTSSTEVTTSTTAPAVAITSVVSIEPPSSTSTSSSSTTTAAGVEPTSVLVLPAVSAANPTTTAVAPDVANGGIQFTLDVSGLTLTNVLNLGNLVPPTAAARP
ncbi:hypothetical protein B0T20DRAFT_241488 [Sordaria brevicollis]|uniref:Uncharacterized protein n=1 Tax=Sordaria brevicollis TaxID=83679 RepID=A0AAE0PDW4_SORBR|nr:hypothetical protein B0T20DRAFT_241488 [Sordaria brevicollis]